MDAVARRSISSFLFFLLAMDCMWPVQIVPVYTSTTPHPAFIGGVQALPCIGPYQPDRDGRSHGAALASVGEGSKNEGKLPSRL